MTGLTRGVVFFFLGWLVCAAHGTPANSDPFRALQRSHSNFSSGQPSFGLLARGQEKAKIVDVRRDDLSQEQVVVTKDKALKRPFTHITATVLTLTLYGLLIRDVLVGQRCGWTAIALICYLIEAAFCSTRRYLSNINSPEQVRRRIDRLREAPPNVKWNAESYHYDRRRNTQTKRVTYSASQPLLFQSWKDVTNTETAERSLTTDELDSATFVKISLSKLILFTNEESCNKYLQQESTFLGSVRRRDEYMNSFCHIEIDGFVPKILAVRTGLGGPGTGMAKMLWYWIFTLLTLTVPYRMWFSRHCDEVEVTLTKEVTV